MIDSYARLIKSLATRLWVRNLRHLMGDISCGKVQQKLNQSSTEKPSEFWSRYSRCLYRNSRGTPIRNKKLIKLAEEAIPGTQRILTHPLWDILAHPDASQKDIFNYLSKIEFNLIPKLFKIDPNTRAKVRNELVSAGQIDYIALENNLDALACLIIFIRETELQKKIQAYIYCKWEVFSLISRLSLFPPYDEIMPSLYVIVYKLFIGKNHPLPPELTHEFMLDYPFLKNIPPNAPLHILNDIKSGILWNAEICKLIPSDHKTQLRFLFWVDNTLDKIKIDQALKSLPIGTPITSLPDPLDKLMERFHGDSRKYLLGRHFYF